MKRTFLGTTALVAAGTLAAGQTQADGIELGLGGYMNTFFSVGSLDQSGDGINVNGLGGDDILGESRDFNATGLFSDGEVHFLGEYTADNGIAFGVQVEMEMFGDVNSGGDIIDQRFIYLDSSWGRIEAGSNNTAAYQMHYAAPFVGVPLNSGWITVFVPLPSGMLDTFVTTGFQSPLLTTYLDYGSDENTLTYYTPRIYGFQLGVSYSPSVVDNGDGKNFPVEADTETEYNNGISVGVNYVEDFNGFGVAVSGGYRRASISDDLDGGPSNNEDYQAWSVGAQLSYAGFTLGGSFADEFDGYVREGFIPGFGDADFVTEGQSWDVGISYDWGPWHYGVTYFQGEVEGYDDGSTPFDGEDTVKAVSGGIGFDIGPGIQLSGTVMWAKYEDEFGFDSDGIVGILGTSFNF